MQCILRSVGAALLRPTRPVAMAIHTAPVRLQVGSQDAAGQPTEDLEYRPITKDRTTPVPLETSLAYLQSAAYRATYGAEPVWRPYRRNHKGRIPPRRTRRRCIRGGHISTGSPCPICRDEYLRLDYRNTQLLGQFLSEFTGEILPTAQTGLCQMQHRNLLIEMHKARDFGTISFDVPFREYDYDEYRPEPNKSN